MFFSFLFAELKYVLRQKMIYIFLAIIALLVFGATVSDQVMIGGAFGNVHRNAPHVVTVYVSVITIFGLLIATAFYNNSALRDYQSNFNEILFSTPLSKSGYYFGRFFSALILSTIPMLGVFLGNILGAILGPVFGWMDADRFGPFSFKVIYSNYFLFILPNMFFAGTVIFAMANAFKSTVVSFVGTMSIIVAYIITGTLLSDIDNEKLGALLDPFAIRTYDIYSKYYTPLDSNTKYPAFTGLLLWNRLIWIAVGFIILFASYWSFSFQEKNKKAKKQIKEIQKPIEKFDPPVVHSHYGKSTDWLQFKSFFFINSKSIIKSVTFKIMFIFAFIMLIANVTGSFEYFGLKTYPVTYKMLDIIQGSSGLFIAIILVFFSGELIWRDRDNKINEVVDATPHTTMISLTAKALSLVCVTSLLYFFLTFCAIIYQLINGFTRIELGVYFSYFIFSELFYYIVLSGVMILIQVIFNNKYLGYFISIAIVFVLSIILSMFRVESYMLNIGNAPRLMYSDISGWGPGLASTLWFNFYWLLFSFICLFAAASLWNRGVITSIKQKIKNAPKQLPKVYKRALTLVSVLWLIVAAYVFYNTQILNSYKDSKERELEYVNYEKKYKKYEKAALPKIQEMEYFIDIFPNERAVDVKAIAKMKNETQVPIDSIYFTVDDTWKTDIQIPGAQLAFEDKELGFRIYKLKEPMQPGDSFTINITNRFAAKGFENSVQKANILENGTFLNNMEIMPGLGYDENMEISDPNKRKKYKLPTKERMPALQANCTDKCMVNYLSSGHSDYINVSTTISTSSDQIAIAPGSLIKEWQENGRNYYQYKVDQPSQNFYTFMSARYEVAKRKWKGVDLEVYYDKKHSVNIEKMLDAMERSLEYYTTHFGPYYHKQCRIIEFPRYATFAQAFPGTMPYSESFGFIINLENEEKNNVVDAVIAHEIAHQWWAHQVVGAYMQGATLLSESFSEYSSLMTMKSLTKNPMKMREFIKYDYDRYLNGRSTEVEKELPLYLVENQMYIHYGKGSVILYALQDYIGEDKVNLALKNFLEAYRYQAPPYPTSLNFLSYLEPQVPDSLKYLVTDWIKEITLYDLRMEAASYKKLPNGKYQVNMDIYASKIKADSIGKETIVPINDWIDIGVFADKAEKRLLAEKRVKINKERMSWTLEVDSLPAKAAIDPKMLLIDKVYDDNSKTVESKK